MSVLSPLETVTRNAKTQMWQTDRETDMRTLCACRQKWKRRRKSDEWIVGWLTRTAAAAGICCRRRQERARHWAWVCWLTDRWCCAQRRRAALQVLPPCCRPSPATHRHASVRTGWRRTVTTSHYYLVTSSVYHAWKRPATWESGLFKFWCCCARLTGWQVDRLTRLTSCVLTLKVR